MSIPRYTGRNRPASNGGPSGVQRSYASQLKESEALFATYEHLSGLPRADDALKMLRKIASIVKPIMRKRGWKVQTLAEFLPTEQNLLGLNINSGYKICIRLRYHNHPDLFLPLEQVVDTMLHELSHNVWGEHDANFHRLWDELRDEHETLLRKGYTGEGFLGHGQKLGGSIRAPLPNSRDSGELRRRARESAEKRRQQGTLSAGSGRRLGGTPTHLLGNDVRKVIADQVERRNTINRGCGSGRADAVKLSQQPEKTVFKTKAEEDEANDRAISQAILELMEEEEERKLQGTFEDKQGGGLAWSKHGGLYDPSMEDRPPPGSSRSEEEQMRWAMEQSVREGGAQPEMHSIAASIPLNSKPQPRPQGPSKGSAIAKNSSPAKQAAKNSAPTSKRTVIDADAPSASAMADEKTSDQWVCEICTLVNPLQFLACDACGIERPRSTSSSARKPTNKLERDSKQRLRSTASALAAVAPPPPKPGLGWNCGECGAFMEHQWWTCSACGRMKPSS